MNIKILLVLFALVLVAPQTYAQSKKKSKKAKTSKEDKQKLKKETKLWKARAKKYMKNPMSLKQLVESKQKADEQASVATSELEKVQAMVEKKDAQIAQLRDNASQASTELTDLRGKIKTMKKTPSTNKSGDYDKGVVFKVQIGAFKKRDLSKYFNNNPNFAGEVTASGEQRVVVGIFRDYWEADSFKKQLRAMGVSGAWIVPFKNGKRVDIKEVVEGIGEGS